MPDTTPDLHTEDDDAVSVALHVRIREPEDTSRLLIGDLPFLLIEASLGDDDTLHYTLTSTDVLTPDTAALAEFLAEVADGIQQALAKVGA